MANPVSVTMDSNKSMTANFSQVCYSLTSSVSPDGSGTVTAGLAPNCGTRYTSGTVVQLTAAANTGWSFSNWSGNANGAANPVSVTMDTDKLVTANFVAVAVPDVYEPDDVSGQAKLIISGTPQAHSIVPASDADWVMFSLSAASSVTLETSGVNGDTRMWLYDAGLSLIEYDDDDGAGYFSWIDRTCAEDPLPAGTYYVKIDEYGNNNEIPNYTMTLTTSPCPVCYSLSTSVSPGGCGTVTPSPAPDCSTNYTSGTVVQLTASANAGYGFANWTGDATGADNPVSVTMDGNKSVTANFTSPDAHLPDDENWFDFGDHLSFVQGPPEEYSLTLDDSGNLYTFGSRVNRFGIAKWDGSNWNPLGVGMNGTVYSLAVDHNGNVYAGGGFTTAGGVGANHIARWDGGVWSALESGLNGPVYALAVDNSGNLYASGSFNTAGGVGANNIAKWDGSSWSALGSGVNGRVYALAFDGSGNLYVGGAFTTAGGTSANRTAKWNGSEWSPLGSGVGSETYETVLSLAFDRHGNLYAGGSFETASGVSADSIARWDGSNWSVLESDAEFWGQVYSLAFDGSGNLYAGGDFCITGVACGLARWDGTSWSALGSGLDGSAFALAFHSSGNLYAEGLFRTAGGVRADRIARWDGSAWSALGSGLRDTYGIYDGISSLTLDGSGYLYAAGSVHDAGEVNTNWIARWNGREWSTLGNGINGGPVFALAFDNSGKLYAGGIFIGAGEVSVNSIAKWDGMTSSWSALGSGISSEEYSALVYALATDNHGNLYAGGDFTTASGAIADYVAKWDGSTWSTLGSGTNGRVSALAVDSSGNLYAGGDFITAGGVVANHIAKWDGMGWSALGGGVNGAISALVFDSSGNLYAGGDFTSAGGAGANRIARWDGSNWSALGAGMNGRVLRLGV